MAVPPAHGDRVPASGPLVVPMTILGEELSVAAARSSDESSRRRLDDGIRLTVAAVAGRLGVAAPPLRTWERPYGLGPSSRPAGRHRRSHAAAVARLDTMGRQTREAGATPAGRALARRLGPG